MHFICVPSQYVPFTMQFLHRYWPKCILKLNTDTCRADCFENTAFNNFICFASLVNIYMLFPINWCHTNFFCLLLQFGVATRQSWPTLHITEVLMLLNNLFMLSPILNCFSVCGNFLLYMTGFIFSIGFFTVGAVRVNIKTVKATYDKHA